MKSLNLSAAMLRKDTLKYFAFAPSKEMVVLNLTFFRSTQMKLAKNRLEIQTHLPIIFLMKMILESHHNVVSTQSRLSVHFRNSMVKILHCL